MNLCNTWRRLVKKTRTSSNFAKIVRCGKTVASGQISSPKHRVAHVWKNATERILITQHPTTVHPDPTHARAATRDRNVLPGAPRSPRMVNNRTVSPCAPGHVPPRSITRCILVIPLPTLEPLTKCHHVHPGHPRTTKCTLITRRTSNNKHLQNATLRT